MSAFHIDLGELEGGLIAVDGFDIVPVTGKGAFRSRWRSGSTSVLRSS